MIWSIFILVILFILFHWYSKVKFCERKHEKEFFIAEVIEYRNEKISIRNDYTKIPYPYVRTNKDNPSLTRVKYAKSGSLPFEIGENIDVFWEGDVLYYWSAYDIGLYKFLPSKWNFWSK